MKKNDTYRCAKNFNQENSDVERIEEFKNQVDKIRKQPETKIQGFKDGPIRLELKIVSNENGARDAITNR